VSSRDAAVRDLSTVFAAHEMRREHGHGRHGHKGHHHK
jgi:hypothetical protein